VVNNREWTYGFGKAADDPNALDAALKLARRGVELRPDDARMWHILASILTSRGDIMSGVAAIEKAAALNPNDRIIAVDLGGRLVTVGQVDRGMKILEAIPKDDVVRPSWQHFYLFLGHYMRGNLAAATHEADEMTSDSYVYGLFARALMAAKNGDMAKARATWSKLVALRSAWQSNPRAELAKFIPAPAILDRLTQDLAATGLMAAN
jgi:tetratricopeptide (TPR) repeat protein